MNVLFTWLDWLWVVAFLLLMIVSGVLFYRLGKRSQSDFFLAGRGLPWWLPASSVYATHTATDTPMWITGVIYRYGLVGIWYTFFSAWAAISAFVSTRIFRRSLAYTQAEWNVVRFTGLGAEMLRGWMAGWQVFMNMFVLGWVGIAMGKVCFFLFGWPLWVGLVSFSSGCAIYVLAAGYWGVVMADFQQGVIAFLVIMLEPRELRPKIIEEERFDDLEDVLFRGVVGALPSPLVFVHDRLEEGAEDGRRDVRPVEAAGIEQALAHGGVEGGDAERAVEQVPVHVGEAAQVLVEIAGTFVFRRIEDLEELGEPSAEVRTVFPRAILQQIKEDIPGFEDTRVVREEAENDTDEELLQIVSLVAGGFEGVVEVAHPFGGLDVDRVLILERAFLYAEDKAELLHMGGQVFERKGYVLSLVQIVQFERLEVTDQNVPRPIPVAKRIEILAGLIVGFGKVAPRAFFARLSGRPARTGR